jgi:hypothetical protein
MVATEQASQTLARLMEFSPASTGEDYGRSTFATAIVFK